MDISEFISKTYSDERDAEAAFLQDNEQIARTLNARKALLFRWKKQGYRVNLSTGDIYLPTVVINTVNA
jgi:ferric-dicitrate binding protein FerR (iron transport regulator)